MNPTYVRVPTEVKQGSAHEGECSLSLAGISCHPDSWEEGASAEVHQPS